MGKVPGYPNVSAILLRNDADVKKERTFELSIIRDRAYVLGNLRRRGIDTETALGPCPLTLRLERQLRQQVNLSRRPQAPEAENATTRMRGKHVHYLNGGQ